MVRRWARPGSSRRRQPGRLGCCFPTGFRGRLGILGRLWRPARIPPGDGAYGRCRDRPWDPAVGSAAAGPRAVGSSPADRGEDRGEDRKPDRESCCGALVVGGYGGSIRVFGSRGGGFVEVREGGSPDRSRGPRPAIGIFSSGPGIGSACSRMGNRIGPGARPGCDGVVRGGKNRSTGARNGDCLGRDCLGGVGAIFRGGTGERRGSFAADF